MWPLGHSVFFKNLQTANAEQRNHVKLIYSLRGSKFHIDIGGSHTNIESFYRFKETFELFQQLIKLCHCFIYKLSI
jgi:hypothetical protein